MTAASGLVVAAAFVGVLITALALCLADRRARNEVGRDEATHDVAPPRVLPAVRMGPFGGHPAIEGWVPTPEGADTVRPADGHPPAGRQSSTHAPGGPHGRPAARRCRRKLDHRW